MFERLFQLLLHAKSGVFAGVFLVGTTGALVTATVQNGVTTITLTEASPSPSGTASPSASASASASPSATASHSASPTASPTGSPTATLSSSTPSSPSDCKSKFQVAADANKTVETAYEKYRSLLAQYGRGTLTDAQKNTLSDAQKLLTQIRTAAEKAIRASSTCFKRDNDKMEQGDHEDGDVNDDNGDNNDEQQGDHEDGKVVAPNTTASPTPTPTPTATPTPMPTPSAVTGTDPKTIADNAVAAMKLVFDTATVGLPAPTATPSRSPRPSRSPEPKSTNGHGNNNGHDGKGD